MLFIDASMSASVGRGFFEEGDRGKNLSSLAVAALRYLMLDPGFLHRMQAVLSKALDGEDLFAVRSGSRNRA